MPELRPDYAERLIRGRRAVRAFRPEPVPDEVLQAVFSLAAAAPSNANTQPWSIEVVSGAARDAYQTDSLRFYGAPHVALLFLPSNAEARMAADLGMYGQTLLLALAAYGIASCPQGLLSFYADTVRDHLGVRDRKLLFGVSFGYQNPDAPGSAVLTGRAALEETTRFHH